MAVHNLTTTALHFGVTKQTVNEWVAKGCPVEQKGGKGTETLLDGKKVLNWYAKQRIRQELGDSDAVDINEAKRRKLIAEASIGELNLMKQRGDVVPVADVTKELCDLILATKAKLLNVPARVSPMILGETDETRIHETLTEEISATLLELVENYAIEK